MSFVREFRVAATRKAHRCDGCGNTIQARSPALRWVGVTDGEFHAAIYHVECREAEVAMNYLHDWHPGDDWYPLRDIDWEDKPWLLAEHPIVAERLQITGDA